MSKVLLINGSPNERGCICTALNEIAETLLKNRKTGSIGGFLPQRQAGYKIGVFL